MRRGRIFHIAGAAEWSEAERTGSYQRSTRGRSLDDVGFVHCSFADQVVDIANCVYADDDETQVPAT